MKNVLQKKTVNQSLKKLVLLHKRDIIRLQKQQTRIDDDKVEMEEEEEPEKD